MLQSSQPPQEREFSPVPIASPFATAAACVCPCCSPGVGSATEAVSHHVLMTPEQQGDVIKDRVCNVEGMLCWGTL